MKKNLDAHIHSKINAARREKLLGQKGCVVWLTGLSGSGKTTLAVELEDRLFALGHAAYILDGDNIRQGLCGDLGFGDEDRMENIRRIAEVARLLADSGVICLTAFISPFRSSRTLARRIIGRARFLEIYCAAGLEACEKRDVKGLYAKARKGEIAEFTGIQSPYEPPRTPDLRLDTATESVEKSVGSLLDLLKSRGIVRAKDAAP